MKGKATALKMKLNVMRISEISQKTQSFKMHYRIVWKWRDCRLLMNCLTLPVSDDHKEFSSFWKPLLRIAEREEDSETMHVQRHMLLGNGWDIFTEEHVSRFRCSFDFSKMPYDTQDCKLTFILPDEPEWSLNLLWDDVTGEELTNAEWVITQPGAWSRSQENQAFSHPFGPANASVLVADFSLERRPDFLVNNYIVQACMFYLVSWVGLWIDVSAVPARAAIGVIPVLVTSNKISALASSIPPISYETRLASFMQLTLAMITMHMLEYGMVHYATRRYKVLSEMVKKSEQVLQDNAESDKSSGPSHLMQAELVVVKYVALYFEVAVRWISPATYALVAGVLLG